MWLRVAIAAFVSLVLAHATVAGAQASPAPTIAANVDREPLVAGEPFELTINIETQSASDPAVRLPAFAGLRVLSQAESHPMSFSFSFGLGRGQQQISRRQSNYSFTLLADKAGTYRLDPVVVTIDGQSYKGQPLVLKVVTQGASSVARAPSLPSAPQSAIPGDVGDASGQAEAVNPATLRGAKVEPDFFLETRLSKSTAVVGEPIVMTLYFYTSRHVTNLDVIREPGTEGFWGENLSPEQRRLKADKTISINGTLYERVELRKLALFPIKSGALTIAPALVEVEVRPAGFFSKSASVKRAGVPIEIAVQALPKEGAPKGFDPANVGRYTFKAEADRTQVKVGEPVTFSLVVEGEGNVRNLTLPEVKDLAGFKVYDPESSVQVRAGGDAVLGKREHKILLIAKEPGEHIIPALSWPFYDPTAGKYETLRTAAITVRVTPGQAQPGGDVSPANADEEAKPKADSLLAAKLRSIVSRAGIEPASGGPVPSRWWFIALVLLTPLGYFGLLGASHTRRRMHENRSKGRFRRADAQAYRRLKQLASSAATLDSTQFYAELQRILLGFLDARLSVAVGGDTLLELRNRLRARGFVAKDADQVAAEIEACEFARFARSTGQTADQQAAVARMGTLIRKLAGVKVTPLPAKER